MRFLFLYLIISQTSILSNDLKSVTYKRTQKSQILQKIYKPVSFISHNNPIQKYGTYLARNISFEPISQIRRHIEVQRNLKLKHRGEAHITILTPPEYNQIREWNPTISMNSINRLVGPVVQYLHFNILGIGSVKGLNTDNERSEVFFLVIRSRGLRAIRKLIAAEWSIPTKVFNPMQQDFHITIGFTVSDLFSRTGFEIKKDMSSIQLDLRLD